MKEESRHILNVNAGAEHGLVYGLGYGYRIRNSWFPIIANVEYSMPSGHSLMDDFKTKIGVQIRWVEYYNLQFSTKIHGVFRRYENDYVRLLNFGSDFSAVLGYYKAKWFVAAEFGFDKAIITHFKHSQFYKDQYAGVINGWYEPTTGGNFYSGLQAGYSFGKNDIYLRLGKMERQDLKDKPMLPFYFQLGYNVNL
jgi:hypothetical protein